MKTNIRIMTVFLIFMTSCMVYPRQTSAQESNVSFQVFYDQLSPYGQWIDYSNYGYVWIPDVGPDFIPYSTDGHWLLTDSGWTWASDYSWGWATFHYGRWSFADSFGWFWVPDNEWGPAWVNWRQADGYYGWSPMEPGVSLSVSFGRSYDNRNDRWVFVRDRDIERTDINHYYINYDEQDRIGRNSVVINNTYQDNNRHATYVSGPSRIQVQQVVGRTITPVVIRENNQPGQVISNGQLRIYRPQVVRNDNSGKRSTPTHVTNMTDVKRTPANNSRNQNQIGNPGVRTIDQPVKTVTPQNINSRSGQTRDGNQQNSNQQNQDKRTATPTNLNNNAQPGQLQNPVPVNNDRPFRRPDAPTMQNNNPQPKQQRTLTPANNAVQPVQQRSVMPQNNYPQPVRKQTVTPQNNTVQPVQQRSVLPQNNNSLPVQPVKINQQNNNNTEQRTPASVTNQNNPQTVQPQTVKPSNNRVVKKQKPVKQQLKKEEVKTPDAGTDKK